jgi:hypothetical protein
MIVVTDNGTVIVGGDDGGVDEEPTPTSPERRPQLGFTWTGGDGEEWDVAHGKVGLLSGARGFGLPVPQHWTAESLLSGAQWNGLRFPAREVFLPVTIETTPFSDIIGTERAFFAGMDPRTEGTLRVTQPDGQWREIVCRRRLGGHHVAVEGCRRVGRDRHEPDRADDDRRGGRGPVELGHRRQLRPDPAR